MWFGVVGGFGCFNDNGPGNFLSQEDSDDSDTKNATSNTYVGDRITDTHPIINNNFLLSSELNLSKIFQINNVTA